MRVIGGTAGGQRLASPSTDRVRPTGDRVREALFSMLGPIEGAGVVDGFAGSGALGIEALSRGASRCFFFDRSRSAIETIEQNLRRTGFADRAIVARTTFVRGLEHHVVGTPDLWLLDPPYRTDLAGGALRAMQQATDKVTPGALVVWESEVDEPIPSLERFDRTRAREYGRTRLTFFRCVDDAGDPTRSGEDR